MLSYSAHYNDLTKDLVIGRMYKFSNAEFESFLHFGGRWGPFKPYFLLPPLWALWGEVRPVSSFPHCGGRLGWGINE